MTDEVEDALNEMARAVEVKRKFANLSQEYRLSADEVARIDLIACIREAVTERYGLNGWKLIWMLTEIKRLQKAGVKVEQ